MMLHRRSRSGPVARAESVNEAIFENLEALESAPSYAAWITELIAPYVAGRILEVGAGRGTYSSALATLGSLTAVEPSTTGFVVLQQVLADRHGACALCTDLDGGLVHGPFDTVVLLNVLEHIENDRRALQDIARGLVPGGRLVLWVPAFPLLLGPFDRSIGHHRRYRRADLTRLLRGAGLEVVSLQYRNLPGWFAWLFVVRVLRLRPTTCRLTAVYDRFAIPVVRQVERRVRVPFGQSLLAVARRP